MTSFVKPGGGDYPRLLNPPAVVYPTRSRQPTRSGPNYPRGPARSEGRLESFGEGGRTLQGMNSSEKVARTLLRT